MLKFLIDESSGKKLSRFLQEKGFDAVFIADRMPQMKDKDILQLAKTEERILITNDKDFGELLFRFHVASRGIIFLRLKKDNPKARQEYTLRIIEMFSEKLNASFIVVTEGKVRMRKTES